MPSLSGPNFISMTTTFFGRHALAVGRVDLLALAVTERRYVLVARS